MKKQLLHVYLLVLFASIGYGQESNDKGKENSREALEKELIALEDKIQFNRLENRPLCLELGKQAKKKAMTSNLNSIQAKGLELLGYAYFLNFQYDSALLVLKEGLTKASLKESIKLNTYAGDAFWYNGNFDSSLVHYQQGVLAARESNNKRELANLTVNIADYYRQVGDLDKSMSVYFEAIEYAKQDTSGMVLPKAYNNTALLYGFSGDLYTELDYYFKAIDASKNKALQKGVGLYYSNIAEVYSNLGDFQKANMYVQKGIQRSKEHNQLRQLMNEYEVLGNVYLNQDSIEQSKKAFLESIRLNEQLKDKRYFARNYGNLGEIERRLKNYEVSLQYYLKGIKIQDEISDKKFKIRNLLGISQTLLDMHNYAEAMRRNKQAYELAIALKIAPSISESFKLSASILEKQGDLKKSNVYYRKYDSLTTELRREDRRKYIDNLEKLQLAKLKELENLGLKKDMEIQAAVIDRQERMFSIGLVTIAVLLCIAFFIYWLLQKNQQAKRKISLQNAELIGKNEEIQSMSDQQENLLHLVVHDLRSPLNKIEGLTNILRMEGGLTAGQQELIAMMHDITKRSKSFISEFLETSQIQYRSRQPKIEPFDLQELINELQREFTPQATQKDINIDFKFNLPNKQCLLDRGLMYHILMNLLSNAIKFSPPHTTIQFQAWNGDSSLFITIQDQGQGFSDQDKEVIFKKFQRLSAQPTGPESSTGLGLFLTKTLVDSLNGKISLQSEENKGSIFTLIFNNVFK